MSAKEEVLLAVIAGIISLCTIWVWLPGLLALKLLQTLLKWTAI